MSAGKPIDPEVVSLAEEYGRDPKAILAIFQRLQVQRGGLTREAIKDVARALRLPAERAYGVATFYTMLATAPRPGRIIRLCDGPACWLCGADVLLQKRHHLTIRWPPAESSRPRPTGLRQPLLRQIPEAARRVLAFPCPLDRVGVHRLTASFQRIATA